MAYDADIARELGEEVLYRLQRRWGGGRLYIPIEADPNNEITQVLGFEAAKMLSAKFGCILLHIGKFLLVRERNQTIVKMRMAGASEAIVARYYGLSKRTVRAVTQGLDIGRRPPAYGLRARQIRILTQQQNIWARAGQARKGHARKPNARDDTQ